jgi:hypothetical protein
LDRRVKKLLTTDGLKPFVFNSFGMLSQGQRIVSLLIIGGLVYACGYFYRRINTAPAKG